jgi:hypothetical protein
MPVARSMRRNDQPSRPSAMTCCFLPSLKTLLMPGEAPCALARRQRLGRLSVVAGLRVSIDCRFRVSTEDGTTRSTLELANGKWPMAKWPNGNGKWLNGK